MKKDIQLPANSESSKKTLHHVDLHRVGALVILALSASEVRFKASNNIYANTVVNTIKLIISYIAD